MANSFMFSAVVLVAVIRGMEAQSSNTTTIVSANASTPSTVVSNSSTVMVTSSPSKTTVNMKKTAMMTSVQSNPTKSSSSITSSSSPTPPTSGPTKPSPTPGCRKYTVPYSLINVTEVLERLKAKDNNVTKRVCSEKARCCRKEGRTTANITLKDCSEIIFTDVVCDGDDFPFFVCKCRAGFLTASFFITFVGMVFYLIPNGIA